MDLRALPWLFFLAASAPAAPPDGEPLWLAHVMPWYAAPGTEPGSGWGWHWTMDRADPGQFRWDGRRELASHDHPLIGPYDSGDDDTLECQVLLMKFAGLDGAVIDWYGIGDHFDHVAIHRRSEKLVAWLRRAGLKFAVCYEDQAFGRLKLPPGEDLAQAARDLRWADEHWFAGDDYVRVGGRPLVLVFGPQHFPAEDWRTLRAGLRSNPSWHGLPHRAADHGFDGFFGWPPVTGGKTVAPEAWRAELEAWTKRSQAGEPFVAVGFPGFRDYYGEAGVHPSYGNIAHRQGKTFAESLDLARGSGARVIQVATWNDYGEGTGIEPNWSHGHRFLAELQRRTGSRHGPADLRLPVTLHRLRRRAAGNPALAEELDRAAAALFAGRVTEGEAGLARVSQRLGEEPAVFPDGEGVPDPAYRLRSDLLYREGEGTDGWMHQRCRLDLYHPVPAAGKPFPTVVWFHGGGLSGGERTVPLPLRKRGLAVVAAGYRLVPEAKPEDALDDAAAAVAWTLRHIGEFGGDPKRVFVAGHSAGAYLTLMLGLDDRWLGRHGLKRDQVAGLIPLSPQVITHLAVRGAAGIPEGQPWVDALAPLAHVRRDAPPILLVTGDREREMWGRYEECAYFWRMMTLAGHEATTLRELDGFGHGDMPEPAFPLLLGFIRK
jgi:acetyl esterase/lipase